MANKEPFGEFDRLRRQIENLVKPLQRQMDLINNTLAKALLPKLNLPKIDLPKIDPPKVDLEGLMPTYVAAVESISRIGRGFETSYLKQLDELSRRITTSIGSQRSIGSACKTSGSEDCQTTGLISGLNSR